MAAQHRLARVGFWEASQGSEGFLEGSLDVLLTSVGAAVIPLITAAPTEHPEHFPFTKT